MNRTMRIGLVASLCCLVISPAYSQEYGIFDSIADWEGRGAIKVPGDVQVEGEGLDAVYELWGNGDDIWDNQDEGLFVYTELDGSWSLQARVEWIDPGTNEWSKVGVMIRENPQMPESRHYWIELRGNAFGDRVDAQWRTSEGGASGNAQIFFPEEHPLAGEGVDAFFDGGIWLRVTRIAPLNLFFSEFSEDGETWYVAHSQTQAWPSDAAGYGLAITDHTDTEQLAHAQATHVAINPAPTIASRSFSQPGYEGGDTIEVTLSVLNSSNSAASFSISETVPAGWVVSNISNGGTESNGTISWTIDAEPGETTVSYSVTAPVGSFDIATFSGQTDALDVLGDSALPYQAAFVATIFHYVETFSYPGLSEGDSLDGLNGGFKGLASGQGSSAGWDGAAWSVPEGRDVTLHPENLDAGLVYSQDAEFFAGNFSARLTGNVGDGGLGLSRTIDPVHGGELWLSFVFYDEGPANEHYAGISLYDENGQEVAFVGKPWNSATAGLGNLPGGDQVTDVDYTVPNHYLVRYEIRGNNSQVSLWMNPDKDDRLNTYDATAPDNIPNIAEIRLRRGGGSGSAYFDNIWISSVPALPPAGAARVDLQLLDVANEERDPNLPAWDVICIDQFLDNVTGVPGYGHDNGNDYYLVVTGHIYNTDANNPDTAEPAFGLPVDRMSGLNGHMLGHFNYADVDDQYKNSIKFQKNPDQSGPFTFDVEPGNYSEVRSIQTVGNGDGRLLATFHYEDGSTSDGFFAADDWFHNPPDLDFPRAHQLIDGMNRITNVGNHQLAFNPALFEDTQPVDPDRVLVAVELEIDEGFGGNFAYNLLHMLAVPAEDIVAVEDWSLF